MRYEIAMSSQTTIKYVTPYSPITREFENHSLVFTHVPKAGGTTLDAILRAVAISQRIMFYRSKGSIYGQFHGLGKGDPFQELSRLPDSAFEYRSFFSGHLPYGTHTRFKHPFLYITILRDPLARLLSQYRFGALRGGWNDTFPFADAFAKGFIVDNLQTRQIAGVAERSIPVTSATLKTAINNLREKYTVVGVLERFDETLKLLISILGWPDIVYDYRQVTEGATTSELMERARKATREFFAYDMELYSVACELAKQNAVKLLKHTPQPSAPRDRVLACLRAFENKLALMPAQIFEQGVLPTLREQGANVQYV